MMVRRRAAAAALVIAAWAGVSAATAAWADDDTPAPVAVACEAYAIAGPITEPTVTMKCSDGSYEVSNPDGSFERHGADGCVTTTDADGNETSVDARGNAVDTCKTYTDDSSGSDWCDTITAEDGSEQEVCAMPTEECIGDECAIAYSTMGGREDCEFCRNFTGEVKALGAPQAGSLDAGALERAAAAVDGNGSVLDKSAALELAGAGVNAEVNLASATTGSTSSAPVAPIAAAVAGTGLVAAGFAAWRQLASRGL